MLPTIYHLLLVGQKVCRFTYMRACQCSHHHGRGLITPILQVIESGANRQLVQSNTANVTGGEQRFEPRSVWLQHALNYRDQLLSEQQVFSQYRSNDERRTQAPLSTQGSWTPGPHRASGVLQGGDQSVLRNGCPCRHAAPCRLAPASVCTREPKPANCSRGPKKQNFMWNLISVKCWQSTEEQIRVVYTHTYIYLNWYLK